jgi:hypothetical protein
VAERRGDTVWLTVDAQRDGSPVITLPADELRTYLPAPNATSSTSMLWQPNACARLVVERSADNGVLRGTVLDAAAVTRRMTVEQSGVLRGTRCWSSRPY